MSDLANAIIKDVLDNHLPRIAEGFKKGYPDENQILVAYDHAVRARILSEQPEPLDQSEIANRQDDLWLEEIGRHWQGLTGKPWETREDIESNVSVLFEAFTAAQARVKELEQERAGIIQALTVEYNGPNDKLSGDLIEDLACFITHHKKKEQRIATLEQALRASNKQLLELINGGASVLAHTPDAPLLSDGGTAQNFLRVQIALAKEVINANPKTIGKSA
jgi:hypothetical protein